MIILFNAPPKAGKTFSCNYLRSLSSDTTDIVSLAEPIKFYARCLYDLGHDDKTLEMLEEYKDTPLQVFHNYTPRQIYINLSESYFKKFHGVDYWVNLAIRKIRNAQSRTILVPDLGFQNELNAFESAFPKDKLLLVQIFNDECTFVGDSRAYVEPKSVKCISLYNDKTDYFYQDLENLFINYVTQL